MSASAIERALAALALGAVACISTTDEEIQGLSVCATPSTEGDVADAIVQVVVDAPDLYASCNGVAIAPGLVMTATTCVAVRVPEAEFNVPSCRLMTGAPIEDGRFEARYLARAQPTTISLRRGNGNLIDSRVQRLYISEAASACLPDITILAIEPAIDVPTVALRLKGASRVGDAVSVSGFDFSEGLPAQHASDAVIEEATSELGSAGLPPRSFLLSGRACTAEGGAVLARDTGAVIGMIVTSSLTLGCDADAGGPRAVQIAPFWRFMLQTARDANATLFAEPRADGQLGSIPHCSR